MAEDGQDTSSSGLTPVHKLPEEVQEYIRRTNEEARVERALRAAREAERVSNPADALERARRTAEKFGGGDPRPGRPFRARPPEIP